MKLLLDMNIPQKYAELLIKKGIVSMSCFGPETVNLLCKHRHYRRCFHEVIDEGCV